MPNYGVIDLGSNSIRLCVYEVKDNTKTNYCKKDFRTLLNNKAMAGLSAHVEDGIFSEQGVHHAIDVLRGHNKRLKYFDCVRTDTFATAVLRNATNSKNVIATIERETGFSITLLSETDEAHLGFVGASSEQTFEEGTLIDIGGGSTELTAISNASDRDHQSIAQGSLSSYAKGVKAILPTPKEMDAIASAFRKKLVRIDASKRYHHKNLYGIGGSLRAAAKVYAEVFSLDNRPEIMTRENFDELLDFYRSDPPGYAHLALKAAPDRIHTVLPGCLIVRSIMKELDAKSLMLCKNGLREGYLIERVLLSKERSH